MKAFRRGNRLVRLAWFAPVLALALTLASCTGSQVSVRDIALDLARDIRVRAEVFFRADSVCNVIMLTHPLIRDSVGNERPFIYERCWSLTPPLDSGDTGIDYDTTGGDSIPDGGPIG